MPNFSSHLSYRVSHGLDFAGCLPRGHLYASICGSCHWGLELEASSESGVCFLPLRQLQEGASSCPATSLPATSKILHWEEECWALRKASLWEWSLGRVRTPWRQEGQWGNSCRGPSRLLPSKPHRWSYKQGAHLRRPPGAAGSPLKRQACFCDLEELGATKDGQINEPLLWICLLFLCPPEALLGELDLQRAAPPWKQNPQGLGGEVEMTEYKEKKPLPV